MAYCDVCGNTAHEEDYYVEDDRCICPDCFSTLQEKLMGLNKYRKDEREGIRMGYYTRFDLEVRTPVTRERAEQIVNRLNAIIGGEDCFELADSEDTTLTNWNLETNGELKLNNWVEDMSQLANEFPDVEFRLEGKGEDETDWWIALFKGKREQIKYCSPPSDRWED